MAYKRTKKLKNRLDKWKKADMLDVGTFAAQVVANRTFDQRRTISGRTLNQTRAYSEKTIYIPTVGVMPKARGGELTKPRKGKGGALTRPSMKFEGGYKEYKLKSTGVGVVNLTASGALRRAFRVLWWRSDRGSVEIGITGAPKEYGLALNEIWPWFGFSDKDRRKIQKYFRRALQRAGRAGRGAGKV